jgi:hypothetical protein
MRSFQHVACDAYDGCAYRSSTPVWRCGSGPLPRLPCVARRRLGSKVEAVAPDGSWVTLQGGERVEAAAVVVAVQGTEAARLLAVAGARGEDLGGQGEPKKTTCLYFAIEGK